MSDIRVECAQCAGRGYMLTAGTSMTTPCGKCHNTGFVTMPDPQPELTRLRAREAVLVEAAQGVVNAFGNFERKTSPELPDGWWSPTGRLIDTEHVAKLAAALATLDVPEKL